MAFCALAKNHDRSEAGMRNVNSPAFCGYEMDGRLACRVLAIVVHSSEMTRRVHDRNVKDLNELGQCTSSSTNNRSLAIEMRQSYEFVEYTQSLLSQTIFPRCR